VISFTPRSLYPQGNNPNAHWKGSWADIRADVNALEKRKSLTTTGDSTPDGPARSLVTIPTELPSSTSTVRIDVRNQEAHKPRSLPCVRISTLTERVKHILCDFLGEDKRRWQNWTRGPYRPESTFKPDHASDRNKTHNKSDHSVHTYTVTIP
jgi:hypothetical protein